jgi:aminoglycoside phosphotransferase (APT) family kinase protein
MVNELAAKIDVDRAGPVRAGEELDAAKLEAHLRHHLPQFAGPVVINQFLHGHSNLTYVLTAKAGELVLRRPPFGNQVQTAHDMSREFRVLSKLWPVFPPAPKPYLYCDDASVLGAPFYLMERRRGLILRKSLPSGLSLDADIARRLGHSLIETQAQLHKIDYHAAGLADLGKPAGYVARQVTGWSQRYENARTDDLEAMEHVSRWLIERMPPESGTAMIHNDFKFDNVVLDPANVTRIVAVLDWEMATLGDPLMDLGTTLGYWIEAGDPEPLKQAAVGPTMHPGSLTRRELVERYEQTTGRTVANPLFYYCFGLFKIAVIIQQIYARLVRGHTHDSRFARLNEVVAVMSRQAQRAIEAETI